ncbi:UNVERIFIED_ORG: hypothetical protein ABIB13_002225 [Arthrobacter sp. UYEF2]
MNPASNTRQVRTLGQALGFFFGFFFVVVFGFLGDRPSRVSDPKDEGLFANAGQWISATVYAVGSLYLLATYGPVGFLALGLAVLIVARRLSASNGVSYAASHLLNDIRTLLIGNRVLRYVVLGSTGLAGVLGSIFHVPSNGLGAIASSLAWGAWMVVAGMASKAHVAAAVAEEATRADTVTLLSKVFGAPAAEWEASTIRREGNQLTVTPPPIQAVLHFAGADGILALVAPGLELSADSDHERLMLVEASVQTVARRETESRTGGLIAGQIDSGPEALPVLASASIAISAEDLI